jgi:pimeloyl-ACP methyl ester carboxylesterase
MTAIRHSTGNATLAVHEEGEGMPFVFQHGLCGDQAQPGQVFPEGIGYRRVTVECRGHGASEPGPMPDLSIATFADDIAGYITASGMEKPVVGGISMGAAIALRLALRRPELVRALVIARPAWLCEKNPGNMFPNLLVGNLLDTFQPEDARSRFEASEVAGQLAKNGPDNLASLRGFFTRKPIDVTSDLLRAISADGPDVAEDEVRAISVPTLVIGHARDVVHPLAYAKTFADWIPGATLVEITPKATNAEVYRSDFRSALTRFLKEI